MLCGTLQENFENVVMLCGVVKTPVFNPHHGSISFHLVQYSIITILS